MEKAQVTVINRLEDMFLYRKTKKLQWQISDASFRVLQNTDDWVFTEGCQAFL